MKRLFQALAIAALAAASAVAQSPPDNVALITTVPGDDYSPTLSPDGQWLVYISERTGDPELFAIEMDERDIAFETAIAPSAAEDRSPVFSPDGDWLAWMSTREDAFGDIWVMRFPNGDPTQVTDRGTTEHAPEWTRESGRVYLRWQSQDTEGDVQFFRARAGDWDEVTPDQAGETSRDEKQLTLLYPDDTNGDGLWSAKSGDFPSVWRFDERANQHLQLTPPIEGLNSPQLYRGELLFSANLVGHLDIAIAEEPFVIATISSAEAGFDAARESWRNYPLRPYTAVGLARKSYMIAPESEAGQQALLLLIDVLREINRPEQALFSVNQALRDGSFIEEVRASLAWRREVLQVEKTIRDFAQQEAVEQARRNAVEQLESILETNTATEETRAHVLLELAALYNALGDRDQTLSALDAVFEMEQAPVSLRARAALQTARAYQQYIPGEGRRLLIELLQNYPEQMNVREDAALELARSAADEFAPIDERILALREIAALAPDVDPLQAAARLFEGRAFQQAGDLGNARAAFLNGMKYTESAPRLAAQSAFALAELQARQGQYEQAIATYESVAQEIRNRFFAEAPRFYTEAIQGMIREYLAKGYFELRVGDPYLARTTFQELIRQMPDLVEAWRGYLDALDRTGELTDALIDQYRREARKNPGNDLALYKYGLAKTYEVGPGNDRDRISEDAVEAIQRAIALNGSVPYYHQTLGFIYEHYSRVDNDNSDAARALAEYQNALALLDAANRPMDFARLLINAGNAAFAVQNYPRAAQLYESRLQQGIPFDDPRTEFLMLRSFGIALFRSIQPARAAEMFERAEAMIEELDGRELITAETGRRLRTELMDRQALALMEAGQHQASANLFARVVERQPENHINRARALRNRGFALHRLSRAVVGPEQQTYRREALESLGAALNVLQSPGLEIPKQQNETSGIFGFSMVIAASDFGAAAQNLSREDEIRLVQAAMARLRLEGGDTYEAIDALRTQLENTPELTEGNRAYYLTARLVTLDQLATQLERAGERRAAKDALIDAIEAARFEIDGEERINANGLSHVLLHLAEIVLREEGASGIAGDLQRTWLGDSIASNHSWVALDSALESALARIDPAQNEYVMLRPVERARLLMGRALIAERQSLVDPARHQGTEHFDLEIAGAAARAVALAQKVIEQAMNEYADAEAKRFGVLAHGMLVRQQARFAAQPEMAQSLQRALLFANQSGYPDMRWWIEAQPAIALEGPIARRAAMNALTQLEGLAPGLFAVHANVPHELLGYLEQLTINEAIESQQYADALSRAERWSAVRLGLSMDDVLPVELEDVEDSDWLARAMELREDYRQAAERLRVLPFTEDPSPGLAQIRAARERWMQHIEQGRAQNLPSAILLDPRPTEIANPARALKDALALPHSIALVIASSPRAVAYTESGAQLLQSPEDWQQLSENAQLWFVLGDRLPVIPNNARVVRMITFETTFMAMSELNLDLGIEPEIFPSERDETNLLAGLEAVRDLRITQPIDPINTSPYQWQIGETIVPLGTLLAETNEITRLQSTFVEPLPSISSKHQDARRRILAGIFARNGVVEAVIDDEKWLGALFTAKELPDIAEAELAASVGLIRAYIERGETARALDPARRIYALRKALELPPGQIMEAGRLLAQIQGDLRRFTQASETMREVVATQRGAGTPLQLADDLSLYASYAADAKLFDEAYEAYMESASLFDELNNAEQRMTMIGRAGVVRENSGYYQEAIALFRQALETGRQLDQQEFVTEQWRRIGRIYLLRQNDYTSAREAFTAALDNARAAGLETLVVHSTIDLARVDERLGLYEQGIAKTEAMLERAEQLDTSLLQADALLTRAFIEWAQAAYLDAFRAQRRGLDIAEQLDDEPFQIIAHNTGGLIYWALNDVESALEEFNRALVLAREGLFPGEVASTLNNRALVYRSIEEYDNAFADLRAAYEIDNAQQNRWGVAYVLKNIGITHLQLGEAEEAIEPLMQAQQIAGEIGDRTNRAKSLVSLGDARRVTNAREQARNAYEEALAEARAIPLPEVEWRALHGLALLAREQGLVEKTRGFLADAIDVVEDIRARIRIAEFQDGFLLDKQMLYDDMVELLLDQGEIVAALEYSERSRARNFIDLLGNQKIDFASVEDQRAIERERELRQEIEELERAVAASDEDRQRTAMEQQLEEARGRYSDFLIELRAFNPQLSAFVEVETVRVQELQQLLDPATRLVVYHVLPNEVAAWILGTNSIDVVRTPIAREELDTRVRAYRSQLQNFDEIDQETAILSQLLWAPVEPLLGNAERVGIAPHRELHLVPFASLRGTQGYVIDRYSLFHTPSASVLRYTFGRRGQRAGNLRVLALGNPELGSDLMNLPFAEKEAERMTWTFPEAEVLTGERATESWLTENIGEYGIVHLATHGEFKPELPLMSAIMLAPDGENDGLLTAREVFGLSINADLVALSACQTGLGRLTSGDEVIGLNRSFVYSGTRQILSSLWRVDDVSTAVMIKHFYRNMDETNRADALRRAQIDVRSRYPHPAHWAGLYLTGDWQ